MQRACQAPETFQKINSQILRPTFFSKSKIMEGDWSHSGSEDRIAILADFNCLESNPLPANFHMRTPRFRGPRTHTPVNSYRIQLPKPLTRSEIESQVLSHPCVIGASPEIKVYKSALPNDPFLSQQKYLNAIGFDKSYNFFEDPEAGIQNDIVVAIIDDGVDLKHEELKDRLWVNQAELNGIEGVDDDQNGYIDDIHGFNFVNNEGDPSPKNGVFHGTHVAGFIAASSNNSIGISGIAGRHARIMVLNIFGDGEEAAAAADMDRAIRYAADNGAKIINISLGGAGRVSTTGAALTYAISKGAVAFAAAGNEGVELNSKNFMTPASFASSISGFMSVGATDVESTGKLCVFSNYSATEVEITAPGCDSSRDDMGLLSTLPEDLGGYLAGTSMATPVVSGAAAMIISMMRDQALTIMSPSAIEKMLMNSSLKTNVLNTRALMGNQLSLYGAAKIIFEQSICLN